MNRFFRIIVLFISLLTVLLSYSCSDVDNKNDLSENESKYVLLTGDMDTNQARATTYADIPSGSVDNIRPGSLLTFDCNGLQSFGQWVFKRANPKKKAYLFKYSVNDAGNL